MTDPVTFSEAYADVWALLKAAETSTKEAALSITRDRLRRLLPQEVNDADFGHLAGVVATAGVEHGLNMSEVQQDKGRLETVDGLRSELHPWLLLAGLGKRLKHSSPVSTRLLPSLEKVAAEFAGALRPHRVKNEPRITLNRRLDTFVGWFDPT